MTIYFYKGLTRNLEIRNTPVWVLPKIWRLRRVRYNRLGTDVSTEMLLNTEIQQGVGGGGWMGRGGKITLPPPTPIKIKSLFSSQGI